MTEQTQPEEQVAPANDGVEPIVDLGKAALGLGDVDATPKPIGPGTYLVEVASVQPSAGKEPPHNPYLAWKLMITEGDKAGRQLFFNTGLNQESKWATKRALLALGFKEEEINNPALTVDDVCQSAIGTTALAVVVSRDYQGSPRDNVTKLLPVSAAKAQFAPL
jgi:hypothetical protein